MRSVAKKVYALSKYIKQKEQRAIYRDNGAFNAIFPVSPVNILRPSIWQPMYDAAAPTTVTNDAIRVKSLSLRVRFWRGGELANCNNWIFLVRPKDEIGTAFNRVNGTLTLINGQHYDTGGSGAGNAFVCQMNPKYFTVLKKKFIGTGQWSTQSVMNSTGTEYVQDRSWTWRVKHPFVNPLYRNISGSPWGALLCDQDASHNLFLVTMSDNSELSLNHPQTQWHATFNCALVD